jgi:RNA polymerase sigma-70 factor, ECF subfamily
VVSAQTREPLGCTPSHAQEALVSSARLERLVADHFDAIWRLLRRLGLPASEADDAAQEVLLVAAKRMAEIEPGKEQSFLYGTALRVAANARRRARARPDGGELETLIDSAPLADELTDLKRLRELFDAALGRMEEELRVVLVLFEVEGLSAPEIADVVGVPVGTVASRLRRGREKLLATWKRLEAGAVSRGGGR